MPLDPLKITANTRFLAEELENRGLKLEHLAENPAIVVVSSATRVEYLFGIASSIVPRTAFYLSDNKLLSKAILSKAGLCVTSGQEYCFETRFAAMAYGLELGTAVVLKPTIGVHGKDVYLPLESLDQMEFAIESFYESQGEANFIIEEFFPQKEYRIFITKNGDYAIVHREPAYVVGDGQLSIEQLAIKESNHRMNPRKGCLCEITLDKAAELYLSKKNLKFDSIPSLNEKVYLRANSNLLTGGTCEDMTDFAHSSVIEIAKQALACFPGLPYAGIDFMTSDISLPQSNGSYRIIEVNPEPGIGMHLAPWKGKRRELAKWIADMIFPESR